MSLIGKKIQLKDGDILLVLDKVSDKMGKDGPTIDKYVAEYPTGRVAIIAPFQIDSIVKETK